MESWILNTNFRRTIALVTVLAGINFVTWVPALNIWRILSAIFCQTWWIIAVSCLIFALSISAYSIPHAIFCSCRFRASVIVFVFRFGTEGLKAMRQVLVRIADLSVAISVFTVFARSFRWSWWIPTSWWTWICLAPFVCNTMNICLSLNSLTVGVSTFGCIFCA